jgi:hypothetical protein
VGEVREREEAERAKVLQQAREELLAGRAELRRQQAARTKRADRRRRTRHKAKAQQQQQQQQPDQEAQEGEEETGPLSGECDAAVAEEAAPAPAPLEGEGGGVEGLLHLPGAAGRAGGGGGGRGGAVGGGAGVVPAQLLLGLPRPVAWTLRRQGAGGHLPRVPRRRQPHRVVQGGRGGKGLRMDKGCCAVYTMLRQAT